MNTLFLFLHLLFIMLSIVNVICFMKLINKISSKQGKDKPEEYPKYRVHESKESKESKVNTVVCVHKEECDESINKLQDKFMDVDLELIRIKGGEVFTVLVDGSPVTEVEIDLSGAIKYKTIRDEVSLVFNPKPLVMNLSEAKNIAEKLNGKVVFVGNCKSVVYDYTKEQ